MEMITITDKIMTDFASWLRAEEKSEGTREKYLRDLRAFSAWLGSREPTKETATEWKEHLLQENYAPVTVNSMLGALNCFFRFAGVNIKIRFVRIQRSIFREKSRELTREEFQRLVGQPTVRAKRALPCCWKPSAPPVSASARCSISPSRRRRREKRISLSRERTARSFCR